MARRRQLLNVHVYDSSSYDMILQRGLEVSGMLLLLLNVAVASGAAAAAAVL